MPRRKKKDFNFPSPEEENLGFPVWYSNDPRMKWKAGSWEEYTNAADQLVVVKSDQGFYSLQKGEDSAPFTPCHKDLVKSEFKYRRMCGCVFPYSKITKTDCKNFRLLLREAEKDLELFEDYFTPDGQHAMLHHDSTVEHVVDRLPLKFIRITQAPKFPSFLERLIYKAKIEHEKELFREYTLFLPKCDRLISEPITRDTTIEECLEMLKDDPPFVAKKFGDLDFYYLSRGMKLYLDYRVAGGDMRYYYAQVGQYHPWQRYNIWKARSQLPPELISPIRFLAYQKRRKGYHVQHPVKEIMKFRAYFGLFFDGVPPLRHAEPSQVGSSRLLERPKKRVRHCRT